jgi:hypothetical protein
MSQFEPLMNRILARNAAYDPMFFTTRFVDGLREDICTMILLHRPKNLDTAFALATLQESNRSGTRGRLERDTQYYSHNQVDLYCYQHHQRGCLWRLVVLIRD